MVYLDKFHLPGEGGEIGFFEGQKRTCYTSFYPFGIFPNMELDEVQFDDITLFYGGNGSGKTTLLNVIAEKLGAKRNAPFNKSNFFDTFVEGCEAQWQNGFHDSTIITSDDVFDYIFDIRTINEGIDRKREALLEEYSSLKYAQFRMRSLDDYEQLKKVNLARRKSGSEFVRRTIAHNATERSNGESALMYFTNKIDQNQVYLLDEPENSLSAEFQQELLGFIQDSARFYHCQFIIATHSPFLLAANGARIYDLDSRPVDVRHWTELKNVRKYFDFFQEHKGEFK